jgi:hypothetical protein
LGSTKVGKLLSVNSQIKRGSVSIIVAILHAPLVGVRLVGWKLEEISSLTWDFSDMTVVHEYTLLEADRLMDSRRDRGSRTNTKTMTG